MPYSKYVMCLYVSLSKPVARILPHFSVLRRIFVANNDWPRYLGPSRFATTANQKQDNEKRHIRRKGGTANEATNSYTGRAHKKGQIATHQYLSISEFRLSQFLFENENSPIKGFQATERRTTNRKAYRTTDEGKRIFKNGIKGNDEMFPV
jgi:hypothetical protein